MPGKGKRFKKGNKAAKGKGRPPVPSELKQARKLTRAKAEELLNQVIHMSKAELGAREKDPTASQLELTIIAIVKQGIKWGDPGRLSFVLDRLIGKVREPDQNLNLNLSTLSRAEILALGEEAVRFLRKQAKEEEAS